MSDTNQVLLYKLKTDKKYQEHPLHFGAQYYPSEKDISKLVTLGFYIKTAIIDVTGESPQEMLQQAYAYTNNCFESMNVNLININI